MVGREEIDDFLDDYEGISGYEEFRGDLGLMYFVSADPSSGNLVHLKMTPTRIKNLRVKRASKADAQYLQDILNREGATFGTQVHLNRNINLEAKW